MRDEADEAGNEELALEYDDKIVGYESAHPFSMVFAIPSTLSFANVVDAGGVPQAVNAIGTYIIDGAEYTLRYYTSKSMKQGEYTLPFIFKIILN